VASGASATVQAPLRNDRVLACHALRLAATLPSCIPWLLGELARAGPVGCLHGAHLARRRILQLAAARRQRSRPRCVGEFLRDSLDHCFAEPYTRRPSMAAQRGS